MENLLFPRFFCTFAVDYNMDMKGLILSKIESSQRAKVFKEFLRFLKENGLYCEFFRIMKSGPSGEYKKNYSGNLLIFFSNCSPICWTTSCFVWGVYNKDGVDWSTIHSKWQKNVIEKKYEI